MPDDLGWVACGEQMPEPGFCLVATARDRPRLFEFVSLPHYGTTQWITECGDQFQGEVTHWMYLPAMPERGK